MSHKQLFKSALFLLAIFQSSLVSADSYSVAIHPVLPEKETRQRYQPLMNYLAKATGHRFTIKTNTNFLTHWQTTKKGQYDIVIDGPQFTGYRLNKLDYSVLAKFPNVVSYTLVANEDDLVMEAHELIGKKIATTPSPALGALRLQQLFPNPLQQPAIVETNNSAMAAERVLNGEASAAIIPAPMVGAYPGLTTVVNTEQIPAPAISASPKVPSEAKEAISEALLQAHSTKDGQAALAAINIEQFEPSDGNDYRPHAELLKGMWEY